MKNKPATSIFNNSVYDRLLYAVRKYTVGKWIADFVSLPLIFFSQDWKNAKRFSRYCAQNGYKNTLWDAIRSRFKYGSSITNYYLYRFYEKDERERATWLTYRPRSCFFRKMNPAKYNYLVDDKVQACQFMADFIKRDFFPLSDISELENAVDWVLQRGEAVIKPRFGTDGKGVKFISASMGRDALQQDLKNKLQAGAQIIEELIVQHPQMSELHPDSVNTLRIQTVLHNGEVHILGAVLRIGNGSRIDNMSSGGLAAAVDTASGRVMGAAYVKDITKISSISEHPITGIRIPGFEIPFWQETLDMVRQMAKRLHMLKTLGWDIAISPEGPKLVEFNRLWAADSFQIPYNRGRLQELAPFMDPNCLYPVQRKYLDEFKQ